MPVAVKQQPHYSLLPDDFAAWLEGQPKCWWFVDGDPLLTGQIDFPCPGDELADVIRRIDKTLLILDNASGSSACGERIDPSRLDELSDRDNRLKERTFLCCWEDADVDWLLIEDTEAAQQPG